MTYALSWPLQQGLYDLMCNDPTCAEAVGPRIFDAAPAPDGSGLSDDVYVTFGDEDVSDWSSGSTRGAVHLVRISVYAPRRGFGDAKQAASAISDAILNGSIPVTRGTVVNARFVDARTRREEDDSLRRIDLRFRITIQDF